MSELLLRGHNPAKSYLAYGPDIVLENGIQMEVKSAHKRESKRCEVYTFSFRGGHRTEKQRLDHCDFVVCWCIDADCFYIIPKALIKENAFNIAIYGGSPRNDSKSTYATYRDNWGLLEGANDGD